MSSCVIFFFFQAEDGIRDRDVTGVQTCALPICEGRDRAVVGVGVVEPADWCADRSASSHGVGFSQPVTSPGRGGAETVAVAVVVPCAGGDLAGVGGGRVSTFDRAAVGTCSIDDRAGSHSQRWWARLSG